MKQVSLDNPFYTHLVYDNGVVVLKREYPQLENILKEVPCFRCIEQSTCKDDQVKACPKLTTYLLFGDEP
jgi:hypothetical protein